MDIFERIEQLFDERLLKVVIKMSEKTDLLLKNVEAIIKEVADLKAAVGTYPDQIKALEDQLATVKASLTEDETAIDTANTETATAL
jgi:prefoldin subunit 5